MMKRSALAMLAACGLAMGPLAMGAEEEPTKEEAGELAAGSERPAAEAKPASEKKAASGKEPSAGGGGLVKPLLIVAGGTVAGAGVGLARRPGKPAAQAPVVSVAATPPETAGIAGVTTFSLRAYASDPDGSVASYAWDFGDGASATGDSVTHRYDSVGTFRPQVVVTDSDGDSATASATVQVGTLTGNWEWLVWSWERCERVFFALTQNGQSLTGTGPTSVAPISLTATISDPTLIALRLGQRPFWIPPSCEFFGFYMPAADYQCVADRTLDKILCDGLTLQRQ